MPWPAACGDIKFHRAKIRFRLPLHASIVGLPLQLCQKTNFNAQETSTPAHSCPQRAREARSIEILEDGSEEGLTADSKPQLHLSPTQYFIQPHYGKY
jgi:hypothetical protein